jgi:adenylate cyclase
MKRRLAAILAADIVGYSRLIRADEEGTLAALQALRKDALDPIIAEHHGRIVKLMGDGVLVEFTSVVDAVRAAVKFQQSLSDRNAGQPQDRRLEFRIGVNLGDVVIDGEDIQGDGVNVAARLEGIAETGGVCISDSVYDQVRDRLDIRFSDFGERKLKNINRVLRVWHWKNMPGDAAPDAQSPAPGAAEDTRPRIAVLPFNNMSGDPEQEYFSDGITEDIITDLSKVSALFVVARNTTFTYKNRSHNLQDVARELSVDSLVEGSVRKAGNRVRITAQLIDGATGGHVWAERYDRELTDIFEVQDEITQEIVGALKVVLRPEERPGATKSQTRNLDAYDLYLRGRRLQHIFSETSMTSAKQLFEQAISIDPTYARAHCGVADCSAFLYQYYSRDPGLLDEMNDRSSRALELAPDLAEAHASRGLAFYVMRDYGNADTAFARAVELDPNLYEAHYYWGRACVSQGKQEEAAGHFYNTMAVSPQDEQAPGLLIQILADLGRTEEMKQVARRTVDNALRKLEREPDNIRACLGCAFGYFRLGDLAGVERQMKLARTLDHEDSTVNYNMACLFALIGDQDSAGDCLEHSLLAEHAGLKSWVENDSDLDSLRDHPKFIALVEAMR